MFNPLAYENSRGDGVAVLEVIAPPETEQGAPRLFVPLRRSELTGVVTGPLAELCLTHRFGYARTECNRVLEAAYRFPLPGDAAVRSVTVRFGETVMAAALKAREEAEAEYDEARRENRQAALATRVAANVFTLLVTGLQPDEEIVVETRYVQLARSEGLQWSLRIPLTTAPRFVRRDELGQPQAKAQPLAVLRDPGHRFALDVEVMGPVMVASPTHALTTETGEAGLRVRLQDGEVLPDRDCVLTWQVAQAADRPALQVMVHDDPADDAIYCLAYVTPPAMIAPEQLAPREVTLLVDHSGSMRGPKWEAADWAVNRFAGELAAHDAFGLGTFHSVTRWFRRQLAPAEPAVVQQALEWLANSQDSGGTELGEALEQALLIHPAVGDPARHVLLITDAEVTDAARILRLADEEAMRPRRRRISVLCIDAAPNAYLAQELAERGGGIARFLTSRPAEDDISTALDRVLEAWAAPVLTGLRLAINRTGVQAAGRTVTRAEEGWEAIDLGDLPAGSGVWVAARVPRAAGEVCFRLHAEGIPAQEALPVTSGDFPAIKACFGVRRVNALEHLAAARYTPGELAGQLARLGYGAEATQGEGERAALYPKNAAQAVGDVVRGLLVREALAYGVLSSETAFVVTRQEAGHPVEGSVAVANTLPAGWSEDFITSNFALGAQAPMPRAVMALHEPQQGVFAQLAPVLDAGSTLIGALGGTRRRAKQEGQRGAGAQEMTLFSGVPATGPEVVLYDTARGEAKLPGDVTFNALTLVPPAAATMPPALDGEAALLLFVGDMAQPRAVIRLRDLIRQGRRPLNVARQGEEPVRVVLRDPHGVVAGNGLRLEIRIGW